MNWVSLLGLVALLLIAWAMSFHRTRVRIRPIAWGLGLQFVFALIILRQDVLSFVGMVAFGLLVTAYILRRQVDDEPMRQMVARVAGAIALGGVLVLVERNAGLLGLSSLVGPIWLVGVVLVWGVGRLGWAPKSHRYLHATLAVGAIAYLIGGEIYGQAVFAGFSEKVAMFLNLSDWGAKFLFGNLADPAHYFPEGSSWPGFGYQFAFKVLPTILFFGGLMGVLYYLGLMQKVIVAISRFMRWTIGTSGAETLSCSANIFVGQTEAPLLIRPYLPDLTKSEILTVMVGGFATIAGGVLAGYIGMGVPAGHLVAATVMSAPAALAIGKLMYPETEHSTTAGDVELPEIDSGDNVIDAASRGITDGLKLAVNVGAMLIGFIALINVVDLMLNFADKWIDGELLGGALYEYRTAGMSAVGSEFAGIVPGSLQTLFGTALKPLAWLMGVPWEDAGMVGNLLGIKLSLSEFVSFGTLGQMIQNGQLSERAIIISTYALCGFANFASIGIQLGGLSALAPGRRGDLAKVGLRAMFGGAIASWTTATVAGMLL